MRISIIARITIVFTICTLVSCEPSVKTKDEITSITLDKQVCTLSDSSYMGAVMAMERFNNGYIILDYKGHKISFLDKHLDVTNSIGSYGKGPGDLNGPIQIVSFEDSLYIFEEMNQRISVFNGKAKFIRHINNVFGGSFSEKMAISGDIRTLYCSNKAAETPLQKVDLQTLEKTYFGAYMCEGFEGRNPFEFYHFLSLNNRIVAIAQADAVIKVYDQNSLELIREVRYDTVPIVAGSVDYIADQRLRNPSPNTTYVLVQDVSRYKNHLYLLIIGREIDASCYHVVDFKIHGDTFQYERVIALDGGKNKHWYVSFLADENCFLAFSGTSGCIHRFRM